MSWIHYIDNEVPWDAPAHYGEWDSLVEAGGSTVVQSTDAAFPDRGTYGLRCQTVVGNVAYVQKDDVASVAPGGEIYMGLWLKVAALPAADAYIGSLFIGASVVLAIQLFSDGRFRFRYRADTGWHNGATATPPAASGRWLYFVLGVKRATTNVAADGWYKMYFDGRLAGQTINKDNYDSWAGSLDLRAGCHSNAQDNLDIYLDEYKVATSYPEPYAPTPADEYPSAQRTAILYRTASADSVAFADYCASQLGIPLANLIPLPDASADEILADYATFQAEVEDGIDAFLALNPTVAANCSCFLIGCGVPGYFINATVVHSAVSRLMNYGTAFSSGAANPLYAPSTVARLTKAALGGKHLCCRIDADTLQHSKDLIDRAATITALAELPDTDTLWGGDANAAYRASLACQKLRILTGRLMGGEGLSADDAAFAWYQSGDWGTGGSRAALVAPSTATGYRLRVSGAVCFQALHGNTFAAALGNSHTADTFDAESFFEMLRIGGTLAEAFIVAVAKLDYTAVGAGSPLLTVAFQLGGYNVYRGLGGIEGIDWQEAVACARSGEETLSVDGALTPGLRYVFGLRAVSAEGVEERNTHVVAHAELDEQGELLPAPLARPAELTAEAQSDGTLLVGFSYAPPVGFAEADGFDLLSDGGTGELDLENPLATVEGAADGQTDFEVSISRPEAPTLLACRARNGEQLGPVGEALCVPAPDAPSPAELL